MIELNYWFMFPVGMIIATIAMMFGIGGAVFFSPFFFLVLNLKPDVAIGTGIFIEVFGFGSGLLGYTRKKLVNYSLGKKMLLFTVPSAIIGVTIGKIIPETYLVILFSAGMIILAFSFLKKDKQILIKKPKFHKICLGIKNHKSCLTINHLNEKNYALSALGGLSLGLISSGLGEINEYIFIKKLKMHTGPASGTSVFIVMITALISSLSHFIYFFFNAPNSTISQILSVLIFTAPGVIIGGQIGVHLAYKINQEQSKKALFILLLLIGIITLTKLFV